MLSTIPENVWYVWNYVIPNLYVYRNKHKDMWPQRRVVEYGIASKRFFTDLSPVRPPETPNHGMHEFRMCGVYGKHPETIRCRISHFKTETRKLRRTFLFWEILLFCFLKDNMP